MSKLIFTSFIFRDKPIKLSCLLDDSGRPVLFDVPSEDPTLIGNIYVGRVGSVVKDINAAFIEYAPGKRAFYSLDEPKPFFVKQNHPEKGLSVGDELLVEITKDAFGDKDVVASSILSFKSENLLLTYGSDKRGISKKITENSVRTNLKEWMNAKTDNVGILARTNACNISLQELEEDYQKLFEEYSELLKKAPYLKTYSEVRKQNSDETYLLNSLSSIDIEEIITDDKAIFDELSKSGSKIVRLYVEKLPLYKVYALETRLEEALAKKVYLKSGGYLYIEPTEALTVIDVNSGKKTSKKNKEENALEINIEAAKEIVTQLSLRNISGIVVVDFINMKEEESNKKLISTLSSFAKKDHVGIQVLGMTRLGLCEITRKKTKKPLFSQIFD